MVRDLLLSLSENRSLTGLISHSKVFSRLARRFVAGESLPEAIKEIRDMNSGGIIATIDHLGENVTDRASAEAAADDYLEILDAIAEESLEANVSVKLTHLGLDIGEDICRENLSRIAQAALRRKNFVRVDMESSQYTDRTLDLFKWAQEKFGNVGVVIQSYLYRSERDINDIIQLGGRVRLCKGAYREHKEVAYPRKADVDANYLRLARLLLEKGTYPAIATHDEKMIGGIKRIISELELSQSDFEFQMLYGIRRDLQRMLVDEGYTLRVYVAFGRQWAPYFMRRLAERPANVMFLLKNLVREARQV